MSSVDQPDVGDSGTLLTAFLEEASTVEAESLLGLLLANYAEPAIRIAVRAKLAGRLPDVDSADIEDVCSDAIVAVIANLREIRDARTTSIRNFPGYVSVIARRCCSEFIRRKYPQFHRLRYRLRYLLETRQYLALWEDDRGEWLCGFEEWRAVSGPRSASPAIDEVEAISPSARLDELVPAIFRQAGGALPFDDLASIVSRITGVVDGNAELGAAEHIRTDSTPRADYRLEQKQWIEWLWSEIRELPAQQRAALLLHLRDDQGSPAIALFPIVGVATHQDLATSMEMTEREVAEIWGLLPLDDLTIAARFGISRQQVINLRQSARKRLARRMAARTAVKIVGTDR